MRLQGAGGGQVPSQVRTDPVKKERAPSELINPRVASRLSHGSPPGARRFHVFPPWNAKSGHLWGSYQAPHTMLSALHALSHVSSPSSQDKDPIFWIRSLRLRAVLQTHIPHSLGLCPSLADLPFFPKPHSPFLLPTVAFSSPWCGFEGKLTFPSKASLDLALLEALPGQPLPHAALGRATLFYARSV